MINYLQRRSRTGCALAARALAYLPVPFLIFAAPSVLAAAAPVAPGPAGGGYEPLIMLALFGAIFYFMIWRPSAKQRKEREALLANLDKGVEVITAGGLAGTVVRLEGDFVMIRVADGVEFRFSKSAVTATLPKGTLKQLDAEARGSGNGNAKGGKRRKGEKVDKRADEESGNEDSDGEAAGPDDSREG